MKVWSIRPSSLVSSGKTEADVAVAVARIVVVTISGPAVPGVVVPRTATQNTVLAF
jgi:hypothetical protein